MAPVIAHFRESKSSMALSATSVRRSNSLSASAFAFRRCFFSSRRKLGPKRLRRAAARSSCSTFGRQAWSRALTAARTSAHCSLHCSTRYSTAWMWRRPSCSREAHALRCAESRGTRLFHGAASHLALPRWSSSAVGAASKFTTAVMMLDRNASMAETSSSYCVSSSERLLTWSGGMGFRGVPSDLPPSRRMAPSNVAMVPRGEGAGSLVHRRGQQSTDLVPRSAHPGA
mmetsp:Transcript_49399/g.127483  ORF Transcript_49399/g.127483 Transcript_49399/m.127483 type:complete len:229 (+) Transcript_49399:867-1553(+)